MRQLTLLQDLESHRILKATVTMHGFAAENSSLDWPTTQQAQAQPQRYNQATYGSPAGEDSVRGGSKVAGKQQMASRGFSVPIQITRMEWGEPRPNAQDTWGKEEPQPQPLPSAMPAEARPSVRRAVQPTAFPPGAQLSGNTQQDLQPAPRARPAVTTHWQRMWTTDSLDHTGDDVRACLHVAKMPGLVDESGGAGQYMLLHQCCTCLSYWHIMHRHLHACQLLSAYLKDHVLTTMQTEAVHESNGILCRLADHCLQ